MCRGGDLEAELPVGPMPWYGMDEARPAKLRYLYVGHVEEFARQAGHADIIREELGTRDPVTDRGRSPGPAQKPSPFAPRLCRVIPVTEPSITRLGAEALARVARFAVQHHREQVTVADLADHAGYSRHHFSRAFTATKSVSPSAYLTALRIESSKALLLTEDAPVIDIAGSS